VERIALRDVPAELGGAPVVLNSGVSSNFDPAPPTDMWLWRSGDGPTEWVALLETALGADLPTVVADNLDPPESGQVESATLPTTGWLTRSWVDSGRWRVAVGYDETLVTEVAAMLEGKDPSTVEIPEFDQAYQGQQIFYPPAGLELSELFYTSPAGGFSIHLFKGWAGGTTVAALRSQDSERTEINGADAVLAGDEINWWITWAIDDQSTAMVESSDLGPDILRAIAESVGPVSVEEWNDLAASASPSSDPNTGPTADSFDTIGEPTILASGERWAVKTQAVTSREGSAEPGVLGLCGWVEVGDRVTIDFGCSIREFGQRLPVLVSTPEGPVVLGELRSEVAEVRFEGTSLTVRPTQIHPDIPIGWFATLAPDGTTLTAYTFWSADGNQLPIDSRTGDQMIGTIHSIS
jgi:hypothetical protein